MSNGYYDPAAFAANQERARQILAAYPTDGYFLTMFGLTRDQFIAANYLDPDTLADLPFPGGTPYPPLPGTTVQPPPAAGATNGTGPTSSTGGAPASSPMTITPTMMLAGLAILYAFSRK